MKVWSAGIAMYAFNKELCSQNMCTYVLYEIMLTVGRSLKESGRTGYGSILIN